jgi:lipopolysaccharide export system permease protein
LEIIKNYLRKEFLKKFFTIVLSFISIYLIVEFFERVDDFVELHASLYDSVLYFLFKLPLIVSQVTPFAVLLATILTFSILSKNSELVAMRASGISLMEISSPIIALTLLISLFMFIGNEQIIPYTNQKFNYLFDIKIRKKEPRGIFRINKIWYRGENNTIWNIELFDKKNSVLRNVTLYRFDEHYSLKERIDASTAVRNENAWNFQNGEMIRFSPNGGFTVERFESKDFDFPERLENFGTIQKDPAEMSFSEIYSYVKELKKKGFDDTKYTVDMYAKLATPLGCFIMALFGIPFSLKTERKGGIFKGFIAAIIIGFSYWILSSIGITLGHSGILPPLIASWMPSILFISVGFYLLVSAWH